jgi:2-polyprenyl-3-methyl-5-hydroxy-6-metoxy-1,4-benzoquinol methylase
MLDVRATEPEIIDDPACDSVLAASSYRFMTMINACTGGTAVVRRFLADKAREAGNGRTLRILDVGAGSCDIPVAVSRWAARRGIRLQFTCLEPSTKVIQLARARLASESDNVQVLQEDVFKHQPVEPYDYATASMCFHHFTDAQILDVLPRLRSFVRKGVLINDLRRTPLALFGAYLLTIGAAAGVRHDAMVSVRRGFKSPELKALLQQVPDSALSIKAVWCFRVSAEVTFLRG